MTAEHPRAFDQAGQAAREIVLTGTFDVRNYGDLLFPIIARAELGRFGLRVRPASPTARDTGWLDTIRPEPVSDILTGRRTCDGLLIGGGNIVHMESVRLPDYVDAGVQGWAYPSLWLGASLQAGRRGWPVAWNAPGVPGVLPRGDGPDLVGLALAQAGYLSVRDQFSADALGAPQAKVVPDTALGLADIWPRDSLRDTFTAILQRNGSNPAARTLAVHVKARALDRPIAELASLLDALSVQTRLVPLLVAIGPCHGDDQVTAALAKAMRGPRVDLSQPRGLREIAAAIAWSQGYAGASMHGYVTAAAYGRPGVIVARPRLPKMAGLLAHLRRPQDEVPSWDEALAAMARRSGDGRALDADVRLALRRHWVAVARTLSGRASTQAAGSVPGAARAGSAG